MTAPMRYPSLAATLNSNGEESNQSLVACSMRAQEGILFVPREIATIVGGQMLTLVEVSLEFLQQLLVNKGKGLIGLPGVMKGAGSMW